MPTRMNRYLRRQWTEGDFRLVERLYNSGKTDSEIAFQVSQTGVSVSENAVAIVRFRLGLTGDSPYSEKLEDNRISVVRCLGTHSSTRSIANATGLHIQTVRKVLREMELSGYIKRINYRCWKITGEWK